MEHFNECKYNSCLLLFSPSFIRVKEGEWFLLTNLCRQVKSHVKAAYKLFLMEEVGGDGKLSLVYFLQTLLLKLGLVRDKYF
jgi:hypothetical protein